MAELLDPPSIENALSALPGWRSDDGKLVRDVPVPATDQGNVEAAIMQVADELNHHPQVERRGDEIRFILWTHSAGGVTSKDVELAARIDQVLSGPAQV
jgi:4a-hydroxytetrahydrobiopterin dehydratase